MGKSREVRIMNLNTELYNISLLDDELVVIEGNDMIDDSKKNQSFHLACFKKTFNCLKELLINATKIELYGFDNDTSYFDEIAIYDQDGESTSINVMAIRFDGNDSCITMENDDISNLLNFLKALEKEHDDYMLKTSNKNSRYYDQNIMSQAVINSASLILNPSTHFAHEIESDIHSANKQENYDTSNLFNPLRK